MPPARFQRHRYNLNTTLSRCSVRGFAATPLMCYGSEMPAGRPTDYRDEFAEQALKLCKLGATNATLADFFEVTTQTINNWSASHQEFFDALKVGKTEADEVVEKSLYQRAVGYSHDAIHFSSYEGDVTQTPYREHLPPDPTSMIFWLKNRKPVEWRDRREITGADGGPIAVTVARFTGEGET